MLNSRISSTTCRIALSLLAAATIALPGAAQEIQIARSFSFSGPMRGGGDFEPAITRSQFKRYSDVLNLGEDLGVIALSMLDGYLEEFQKNARGVRQEMRDLQEEAAATQDWSILAKEMTPLLRKWSQDRELLDNEFISGLKAILDEDQLGRWPTFERERRRHKLLPNARLSGEDIDLIDMVHSLHLEEALLGSLEEALDNYANDLDLTMQARDRAVEALQDDYREASRSGDKDESRHIWTEATRKRATVRDVNRRYRDAFAIELGDELGLQLEQLFSERAYPMAYEPTKADRFLEQVEKLSTLTDSQLAGIDSITSSYHAGLDGIIQRLIREIDKQDEDMPPFMTHFQSDGGSQTLAIMLTGDSSEDEEDPVQELLKDRFQLSKSTIEQVKQVLTPEQVDSIPPIETENAFYGNFRRFGSFRL